MSKSESLFSRFWSSWSTDRILGLSAMFISLLTLITFVYQTNLMKKQAGLSVLPYLAISSTYANGADPTYQLKLVNQGVGPAIIESRIIRYNNKEYRGEFHEFLVEQMPALDTLSGLSYAAFDYGSVLPSGEEIFVIAAFEDLEVVNLVASKLEELAELGLDYEIIYRSIYDDRWMITSQSDLPTKLKKSSE